MRTTFPNTAPGLAQGGFEDGYEPLARRFAANLDERAELGAAIAVYRRGVCVAHLWGGRANVETGEPWGPDSRIVVFSVTKGFVAMALHLAAVRGCFEWDAPVGDIWPELRAAGKEAITFRQLFNHRGGLAAIDEPLTLEQCMSPNARELVRGALERQRPAWQPGTNQGYHALSFGLYAREVFERITGEPIGEFLRREIFEPLRSDARLGARSYEDGRIAALYPPSAAIRIGGMFGALAMGASNEARVMRSILERKSLTRRSFANPSSGREGLVAYNGVAARRAELPWASATSSADGIARAYLPFSMGGEVAGKRFFDEKTLEPIYQRQSWSERDLVLQRPLGWSQGFLKEDVDVFSPNPESFGHAGLGGALGWCDPVAGVTVGYCMNRLDWRVRSPRALSLMRALYASPALRDA
ncbi:MAG: beta-lactamase family protein [Polyangiaceae bacterium]|nr:beta-lactamase family protein [Polyangiaceae bacterium]